MSWLINKILLFNVCIIFSMETSENIYMVINNTPPDNPLVYNGTDPDRIKWYGSDYLDVENISALLSDPGCTDQTACNYDEDATEEDGSCLYMDCADTCGGNAYSDECGECSEGFSGHAPNIDKGCDGICFSELEYDVCEVCGGLGLGTFDDGCNGYYGDCWNEECYCKLDDCPFNPDDCPLIRPGTTFMDHFPGNNQAIGVNKCVPVSFQSVNPSTTQAFYYPQTVKINGVNIESNNWVAAYNANIVVSGDTTYKCVGARRWDTSGCGDDGICDIPVFGDNGLQSTEGYCVSGDIPTFKIFADNTYYDAVASENIGWSSGEVINIDNLTFCEFEIDECGECGGAGPSGCDNACGSTLENDECGVCGGGGIADGDCDCDGNTPLDLWGSNNIDCDGNELSLYNSTIPNRYSIKSIYPNPFNPITNITYGIPKYSYISISVYNLSGNKITSLINDFQNVGYNTIIWNASNFPSGIYLIKIESGMFAQTKKAVLVK